MIAFSAALKPQSVKAGAAAIPTSPATRPAPSRCTSANAVSSISHPPIDEPTRITGTSAFASIRSSTSPPQSSRVWSANSRSEQHTSELQHLMRTLYDLIYLNKKTTILLESDSKKIEDSTAQ